MVGVRVWNPEKKSFGELSDIDIQKGQIKSIKPTGNTKKDITRYLLPGFCDASVTLSVNSMGGEMTKEALPSHLLGFLSTGFSHVESVADPNLDKLKEEIERGRLVGPLVSQSHKPILLPTHFPSEDKPLKQYDLLSIIERIVPLSNGGENRSKIVPVFLKRSQNNSYSQTELFYLRTELRKKGLVPVVYSFIDPLSWEDALDSGFDVIFHLIPPNANLEPIQRRNYLWSPMMNITYLKSLKDDPLTLKSKLNELSKFHPVFVDKFYESFIPSLPENGDSSKAKISEKEFIAFREGMKEFPKERLLFSSGAGHYSSFPGMGAILEADLWLQIWKNQSFQEEVLAREENEVSFWQRLLGKLRKERILEKPHVDPESVIADQMELVDVLTRKTCNFLKADHKGLIQEGGPAHFSVHKRNPFVTRLGIFAIESMVLGGKLVYTPKPEKVGKKP